MKAIALLLLLPLVGCDHGDTESPPPPIPDAAPSCPLPAGPCQVDVSGRVVDLVTGEPITTALEIGVTTASRGVSCQPLDTLSAGGGTFVADDARCSFSEFGSLLVLTVDEPPGEPDWYAPTAFDRGVECGSNGNCLPVVQDLRVPELARVLSWRRELGRGGMPDAATRGLAVIEFRDAGGEPVAGVSVTTLERTLAPAREVRYLTGDRMWLLPADAQATSESGLAVVAVDGIALENLAVARIGGAGATLTWDPVWMGFADGWVFVEEMSPRP